MTNEAELESHETEALPKWLRYLPLLVFALALGLRLIGIGWGLPNGLHNQSYHPDEQVIWAYSQQIEPTKLDFTPGFYNYGTLYLTLLRIASDVVAGYGSFGPPSDPQSVWRYMGACHLAGRVLSALAGSVAVLFVFLLLRGRIHVIGAAAGALLLAVSPSFLVHSRFQTVDVVATMFLAISLWQCARILDDANPARCAAWAGVLAGLSAGTKYTGVLMLIPIAIACVMRAKGSGLPKAAGPISIGGFLLAFFLATPGVLLESSAFLRDFRYEMLHTATGHGLVFEGMGSGFLVVLVNLGYSLGVLAVLLSLVGLIWSARIGTRWIWLALAFAVPYYILLGRAEIHFVRYTFPLLLVLALGFGWLVGRAHELKGAHRLTVMIAIVALGVSLQLGTSFTSAMAGREPRDTLAEFLKGQSNESTTVGIVSDPWYYTPALIPDVAIMRGQRSLQLGEMDASHAPRVVQYVAGSQADRYDWDVRLLDELRPDYVVFSNFEVGPVARLSETTGKYIQVDRFKEFESRLTQDYALVGGPAVDLSLPLKRRYSAANHLVEDLAYVRPVLWLWKRKG